MSHEPPDDLRNGASDERPNSSADSRAEYSPPADLAADPRAFWSAGVDLDDLGPPPDGESTPALKHLGQLSLPGGGFPVMGLLATVYEQIANLGRQAEPGDDVGAS